MKPVRTAKLELQRDDSSDTIHGRSDRTSRYPCPDTAAANPVVPVAGYEPAA